MKPLHFHFDTDIDILKQIYLSFLDATAIENTLTLVQCYRFLGIEILQFVLAL
jgi:hypothetical protein